MRPVRVLHHPTLLLRAHCRLSDGSSNGGAIAAGVLVPLLVIGGAVGFWFYKRRQSSGGAAGGGGGGFKFSGFSSKFSGFGSGGGKAASLPSSSAYAVSTSSPYDGTKGGYSNI
jgi:hypothetical protein